MNASLKDFLREQAARNRDRHVTKKQEVVHEWTEAIKRFYDTIRSWLKVADPDEVIEIVESRWDCYEEGMGSYSANRLNLFAPSLSRAAWFEPVSRHTVGKLDFPPSPIPQRSSGRVDFTDGTSRVVLYRYVSPSGDQWFAADDRSGALRPFSQEEFESTLTNFLQ